MSAQACLASLFRPFGNQVWNEHIPWQPVPVHSLPRTEDPYLSSEKRCDRFDYVMLQFMNTTAYTNYFTKNKELISYLEKHSGMDLQTITGMILLYDVLWVQQLKGMRFVSMGFIRMRKNTKMI